MASRKPLSIRQQQILDFIVHQINVNGYGPTVREIVEHVGDKSPTSVHRHLKTLEARGFILREANKSRSIRLADELRGLPLVGVIAAGSPIEAIENQERLDPVGMYDPASHFVLRVRGDSMTEDHIDDGDLIVVRSQSTCRDGDTVVALMEGGVATLKRFFDEGTHVRLQPANSEFEPIIVSRPDVDIQGVVVGIIRRIPASMSS